MAIIDERGFVDDGTTGLSVKDQILAGGDFLVATSDVNVYVGPGGSDSNPGTQSSPFATLERSLRVSSTHKKGYHVNLLSGTNITLTQGILYRSVPTGPLASAVVIVGSFYSVFGDRTSTAATSTKLTDSTLTLRAGSAASIVTGAAAGSIRITGVTGYAASDVGSQFSISGGASSGNNGTFQISAVNSATSIDVINAQAVVNDANNGSISWVESLEGAFLEITSGTAINQRRLIISNTATSFTVNLALSPVPTAGAVFKVIKPAATINWSGSKVFDSNSLAFAGGVKISNSGDSTSGLTFRTVQTQMEGVEIDLGGGSVTSTNSSALIIGQSAQATAQFSNDTNTPFLSLRNGCGAFIHNGTLINIAQSRMNAFFVWRSMTITVGTQSNMVAQSISAARSTLTTSQTSTFSHAGIGLWDGQLTASSSIGLINGRTNSEIELNINGANQLTLQNSGGDAVNMQTGATALIGAVVGTGSTGVGISVDNNGYAMIDVSAATATTVSGTQGALRFGHTTSANVQTYATARTPDVSGSKGYQDTYGNRVDVP